MSQIKELKRKTLEVIKSAEDHTAWVEGLLERMPYSAQPELEQFYNSFYRQVKILSKQSAEYLEYVGSEMIITEAHEVAGLGVRGLGETQASNPGSRFPAY
jgi:hypothetical protein